MKRTYIQPTIEIHHIKNVDIICGSGESRATIYNSGTYNPGTNQYYGNYGIWGE